MENKAPNLNIYKKSKTNPARYRTNTPTFYKKKKKKTSKSSKLTNTKKMGDATKRRQN